MESLDHIILKLNDLKASVPFYTEVMGFTLEGVDGPFTDGIPASRPYSFLEKIGCSGKLPKSTILPWATTAIIFSML